MLTFIELPSFSLIRDEYLGGDEGLRALQNSLVGDPRQGDVMPGCGGFRKSRWPDARRGKGQRSGLRVIYLYVEEAATIVLFTMYDKDKSSDLTSDQKRLANNVAEVSRDEILKAHRLL